MAKIVLRRDARNDLQNIDRYSREQYGLEVAGDYMAAIRTALRRISDFPLFGALFREIKPPPRYVSCRNHRIFYDFDGDVITIVRVLHQAQNVAPHLQGKRH